LSFDHFFFPDNFNIFKSSLFAPGQCGITLTAASRVYLLEPCVLPSDEVQAAGRISRLGQTKAISLVRLVAKDTVDEAIIEMHQQFASGAKQFESDGNIPAACIVAMAKKGHTKQPPVLFLFNSNSSRVNPFLEFKSNFGSIGVNAASSQVKLFSKLKELIEVKFLLVRTFLSDIFSTNVFFSVYFLLDCH